ncbi:MAG TPA: hypothetical protein VFV98_18940 [Vicinamibacterales bacterium]|nr:hypothetical protein [Vicinamibacterales bacterium]
MIGRPAALLTLAVAIATSCKAAPPPPPATPPQQLVLVNKLWRVTAPASKPLGSMYLFLPDGTLLMTSCVETYRLAKWSANADGTLTITEDAATTYRATYQAGDRTAKLTFALKSEQMSVDLRVAEAPFVCPDLRR